MEGLLLRSRAGVTAAAQAVGHSPDGAQSWLNWVARDRATHAPVGTVQATITDDEGVRSAALAWVVATSRQGELCGGEVLWVGCQTFSASRAGRCAANCCIDGKGSRRSSRREWSSCGASALLRPRASSC